MWQEPFVNLRVPKLYNLRSDPFERADESMDYAHWRVDHVFALVPAQAFVGQWLSSFKDFPPRQKAGQLQHRSGDAEVAKQRQGLTPVRFPPRPAAAGAAVGF